MNHCDLESRCSPASTLSPFLAKIFRCGSANKPSTHHGNVVHGANTGVTHYAVARKQQKTAAAVCFHGDTWNSNAHDVGSFHPQPACLKSKMEVQWWKPRSHNCPCEHGIFFQKLESTQFLSLRYHPHGRWSQIWPLHQSSCARKSWISGLSSLSRRLVPVWIGQGCVRKSLPSQTNRHHEKGINCYWNGVFWKWKTPNANKLSSFAPFDDWGIPQYPGQYRNPPNGMLISHHFRYVFEPAETPIFCG